MPAESIRYASMQLRGLRRRAKSWFVIVVPFEQQASVLRLERAVEGAGRAAGIGVGTELLSAVAVHIIADDQIAGHDVDLLPVFVDEGRGRVHAGLEPQMARAKAFLLHFVE